MISKSQEEYLKTMYILQMQNGEIRVTDIANKMECSKPSVNKVLKNLKDNKLINYETYGKIELTEEGKKLSKKIIEAYDIVFVFFKDVLGLKDEDSKKEAEKVKSVLSDNAINELAKYVHKALDLNELSCDYDINNERCRSCERISLKEFVNSD